MNINYLKLYFCLTLSSLTTLAIVEVYFSYQLHLFEKEAKALAIKTEYETKAAAARLKFAPEKQQKISAQRSSVRAAKQREINNARKTNNEICNFWRGEYQEARTDRNKLMMDGACERARND
jgi:hypothetical protein